MSNKQFNRIAMYRAVQVLLNVIAATLGIPALVAKLAKLNLQLDRIAKLTTTQSLPLASPIAGRDDRLASTTDRALTIAGLVLSYATDNHRPDIAVLVRLKRSEFRNLRLVERIKLFQRIHDTALPLVPLMADYQLTVETLTEFQDAINVAVKAVDAPTSTAAEKRTATSGLRSAIATVNALLVYEIDPLIELVKDTHPSAYALYQSSRQIFDRPGTHSAADLDDAPPAGSITTPSQPSAATPTP